MHSVYFKIEVSITEFLRGLKTFEESGSILITGIGFSALEILNIIIH